MLRLFVKDNTTGRVHEYGTNKHDALILQDDGSLHYENLQCCVGTMFPEEGYSFCNEDGTIPKWDEKYESEPYIDIGGEHYNKPTYYDIQLKPCKTCRKVKSQKMRTDELLYRLREIMPELGENEVADEMYKIVFEYAEQDIEENEITEVCPHCENEITMQWSIKESGYKAYCPVCGKRLMLCTACHDDTGNMCDYDIKTNSCKFNPHCVIVTDTKKETLNA